MRTQLRIVAGQLRGRKLTCTVNEHLRPAPEMVRAALFNILGDDVRNRPFYDLFAGTGAVGFEALSRGASRVFFIERDSRTAAEIERHLREFKVSEAAEVVRADVYRWVQRWPGGGEPVNVFLGPPYADYQSRGKELSEVIAAVLAKAAGDSIIVLQSERLPAEWQLPNGTIWDERRYGRNHLWIGFKRAAEDAGHVGFE
jgi:16S rRNA (guanine966-N2)-methyltransferase